MRQTEATSVRAQGEQTGSAARVSILGVNVSVIGPEAALAAVTQHFDAWRGQYVTACNVHAAVTAHDDPAFCAAENGAVLTLPDGKPLTLVQRKRGYPNAGHAPITALMEAVLAASGERGLRHYFYGSTAQTQQMLIRKLVANYPGATIAGSEPSVFRALTHEENDALVKRINQAAPDFVWVGLGVPRQELWMAQNAGRVHALMLGVGGGFDVLSGNVRRAPKWMQTLCLEWLFRLLQEPKRLFRRYLVTNTRFLYLLKKEPHS